MQDRAPDGKDEAGHLMEQMKAQEPPVEQEPVETTPAPDFQKELESANTKRAELKEQMQAAEATANERIAKLEGALNQVFGQQKQAESAPEPESQMPVPTEEQFLDNPRRSTAQMADAVVQQRLQESEGKQAALMNQLVEAKHRAEIKSMEGHEFYEQVKSDVELYFDQNPNQRVQSGAVENAYAYFVGRKLNRGELDLNKSSQRGQSSLSESSAVPNPVTTPTPVPDKPQFESTEEADMARVFKMDAKEWNAHKDAVNASRSK